MSVCRAVDDYIRDKVRWVVDLSNGETIYEDDNREGESPPSAWMRLRDYCKAEGFYIVRMRIQFRTHIVYVGDHRTFDAFYFTKCVDGYMGYNRVVESYIVGYLQNGEIHTTKWRLPELVEIDHDTRVYDPDSISVISKYDTRTTVSRNYL